MMHEGPANPLGEGTYDRAPRLEELVDRAAAAELCKSVFDLFGIPVRIFSAEGALVAESSAPQPVCGYVAGTIAGRAACASTVGAVKAHDPSDGEEVDHPCFTGAAYRIVGLDYDGRRIGRVVLGPFVPAALTAAPASLTRVDASFDEGRALQLLGQTPRVKPETLSRIARHLKSTLDLILFSGHKQVLTTQLHLASVKESYRELEEKTAKLTEAYERLKELDRLKSNFLAVVSHELRTPLTSIIGYSEMLAEGIAGEITKEQREFVTTIQEKGEQLLGLIMSLLDLSKLESGTLTLRKKTVALDDLLREVLTTVLPVARRKGVELRLEVEPSLAEVRGDPERLTQVFLNLVDNAIKFTPAAGTVRVVARAARARAPSLSGEAGFALLAPAAGALEVRVEDTGIGVPAAEVARIFDAFYQVDSSSTREHGGAGLGLAIVKRLVEGHGGRVRVEANEPTGAVFVVELPRSEEPRRSPGGPSHPPSS